MAKGKKNFHGRLLCGAAAIALLSWTSAQAQDAKFDIAPQSLDTALREFGVQSGVTIMADAHDTFSKQSPGFSATADPETALKQLLAGTGLSYRRSGDVFVVGDASDPQSAGAAGGGADAGTVQALVVTAQKREENIQDVPIAMSAFTQEDLTRSQVAGGPDLMTQVPNFTFTKTNFTGYSIQIRGIGTQAISATTDAAVAVALNNTPFIRNRFFEQEFYDLERVEVLRGPQGTLYGRNATAGVVNIITAKPKFSYDARLSADLGNYNSQRFEGMLNVPLVDDKVALRLAGAWTKRDGYDTNQITGNRIDGRDLWSTRLSLRVAPTDSINVNLMWEHFNEDDDRLRSGKQLCHTHEVTEVAGFPTTHYQWLPEFGQMQPWTGVQGTFSQGCVPASLYAPESFELPNGMSIPYIFPVGGLGAPINGYGADPYYGKTQSRDLRVIESTVDPVYRAKSDIAELQFSVGITPTLTLASETSYSVDWVFSQEDYNRFNSGEGLWTIVSNAMRVGTLNSNLEFCDPQIGCSSRLVAIDLSTARSRQFSQEFRLASDFDGAFNFSMGANFLRYDTEDKYYLFANTFTAAAAQNPSSNIEVIPPYEAGVTDNHECLSRGLGMGTPGAIYQVRGCIYIDPNPISSLDDNGHNYFLSKNPYKLISYAVFGEGYYNIAQNLELTAGLRWTVDRKEAPRVPSWLLASDSFGYPVAEVIRQTWREPTGRLAIDWTPDLSFTDRSLLYASFAHGYKAGGTNPPNYTFVFFSYPDVTRAGSSESATHPKTFAPEYVDAYELGAKNTILDGRAELNIAAFYYDYTGYQISQIVDRAASNLNFDAKVWGAEVEAAWRPLENLRLGFKGGYEKTRMANGSHAIDLIDRTADHEGWVVVRPFPTFASNCIMPEWLFVGDSSTAPYLVNLGGKGGGGPGGCELAFILHHDPVTNLDYVPYPTLRAEDVAPLTYGGSLPFYSNYPGWDPSTAPNNGEGFFKDLSGHELPNAPHFTATATADYTLPLPNEWLMTLHGDFYYQSEAWTRIFNTPGYDKLKAYTNVNLAAIFSNEDAGWKVMAYVKNVFDHDSITGAFLNSDDTGLTTNVFLNEPRLYGLRVTKEWTGTGWWTGVGENHEPGKPYPLTIELGGMVQRQDAPYAAIRPSFAAEIPAGLDRLNEVQNTNLDWGDGRNLKVSWQPADRPWRISASYRYGKTNGSATRHSEQPTTACAAAGNYESWCAFPGAVVTKFDFLDVVATNKEEHRLAEFEVGREYNIGSLRHSVSFGISAAEFHSRTSLDVQTSPDLVLVPGFAAPGYPIAYHMYSTSLDAERDFDGAGPEFAWSASKKLIGNNSTGHLDLEGSLGGGVLIGRQKVSMSGSEGTAFYEPNPWLLTGYAWILPAASTQKIISVRRSNSVTSPVAQASLGFSYDIDRIKLSTGYRWERYFNAIDGGYAEHKSYDRTIDGPYFKIAVGVGG